MNLTKNLYILPLLLVCSCARFTPSVEINNANNSFVGEEAFKKSESLRVKRLNAFAKIREEDYSAHPVDYRIGINDELSIRVLPTGELNGEYTVNSEGKINFPFIGEILVSNLKIQDVERQITKKYINGGFFQNPSVSVQIKKYRSRFIKVIGVNKKSGLIYLNNSKTTLSSALAKSGAFDYNFGAKISLVPAGSNNFSTTDASGDTKESSTLQSKVLSESQSSLVASPFNSKTLEVYLDELLNPSGEINFDIPLVNGDTVFVAGNNQFYIQGEVNKPGHFEIKDRVTVQSAISAAGGFSYAADASEVILIRELGEGNKVSIKMNVDSSVFNTGKDILIRDGDTIIVPSSTGRYVIERTANVFKSLFNGFFVPIGD